MATESKDVELRVRARDYSEKTLDKVAKALKGLQDAQEAQLKSAKEGSVSARELERSYAEIEKTVQALVRQSSAIKLFEAQAKALDDARTAADAARTAQANYAKSLGENTKLTAAQTKEQTQLANAVRTAEKQVTQAESRVAKATETLKGYGIATDQLGAAQQRIVASVNQGNQALERQATALQTVDKDIRDAVAANNALAAAEAQTAAAAKAAQAQQEDWRKQLSSMADSKARLAKEEREGVEAERKMAEAMRVSAQQAEATSRGYQTLARSVSSIKGGALAEQLRAIADPTSAANRNISGLGDNIDKLSAKVSAINGPVRDFRNTMTALDAAQKAAVGIASQIDAYQRQIQVLRAARTEYANAQTTVKSLADAMRAGGGDAATLGRNMTTAQAQLRAAANAMREQLGITRDLREGLRNAGVDTRDLGAAQIKLVGMVNNVAKAVQQLSAAYKRHGAAVDDSSKSMFKWLDGGRTTLSYTQRLRGELLGLATAYVGIQGGINLATGALEAYRTSQKISSQLGAVVGNDAKLIREEWDYLMKTANRIGFSFQEAAPAYAKFAIAAKAFGFNMQETRFVFEKFAEAGRVAGQSASEFEGILKAVEQMLSKGKIQAEELRGQLGDRLPGAFTLAAKAAGVTTAEFTKMMEEGKVGADTVLNIARELPNQFQGIDKASQSLAAAEARFSNAAFEFKKAIAENGFADAYTEFLNKLTALLGSDQGKKLAQALSGGFEAVIKVLSVLADNIDNVKLAFSLLIALTAAKWMYGVATGVFTLIGALGGLLTLVRGVVAAVAAGGGVLTAFTTFLGSAAAGAGVLRIALLVLTRTVPLLAALSAAIYVAVKAYDLLFKSKQRAMEQGTTGNGATGSWDDPNAPGMSPTADPGSGSTAGKRAAAAEKEQQEKDQKKLDKALKAAKAKSAKEQLDVRADLIKEEYNMRRDAAKKEITDAKDLATTLAGIDKLEKQALQIDAIKFHNETQKAGEAAGNKRVQLQEQIKNELLRIQDELAKEEDKLDKNSSFEERKASRVDAIAHAYDRLKKTISQLAPLDKAGAEAATLKLNEYIKQRQAQEEIKVTGEEIKKLEKELTDQQTLRTQSLERIKAEYESGLKTQADFLAESAEATRAGDDAVKKAAANLQKFADAAVAANKGVISLTDQSDIRTKTTLATATSSGTNNENNDRANKLQEQAINNLIAKRTAAEAIFKAQFDLRVISEDEYAKKVNENATNYNTKIATLVDSLKAQLEVQRQQGIQDGTLNEEKLAALDAQIAKMKLLGVETKNAATQADTFQKNLNKFVDTGLDTALSSITDELTKMAEGTETFQQGLKNMGIAVVKFVAQFLLEIGKAIIKQMILNALAGSTNPYISAAGRAAGGVAAPVLHAGGRVGGAGGRSRNVPMDYFVGAQKFHDGGLPGLAQNEVPAILQKGEQVLSRDDPNNILNAANRATQEGQKSQRFVLVDDRARMAEAMLGTEGEEVWIHHLRANAATVRQFVKG